MLFTPSRLLPDISWLVSVAAIIATGVNGDGRREALGFE
jgi:hypothetical protein